MTKEKESKSKISGNLGKKLKTATSKLNLNSSKSIIGAIFVVVLAFLVFVGVLLYRNNESGFVKRTVSVLPYPAAIAGSSYVRAYSYLDQLDILKNYYKEFKSVDFNSAEGKEMLQTARKEVMERLIEDAIVEREARRMKVSVGKDELNSSFDQLVVSNGGTEKFSGILNKYYGVTIDEYKKKIYEPRMLRQKLTEAINSDQDTLNASKAKADEIYAKVKNGEDFEKLAKENSQDPGSAANGGDLGFFSKGKMVPEFEQEAFKLKKGAVSAPVRTVYGYHIIKVTDKKGSQVKASHILIKVRDFNEWLEAKKTELSEKKTLGFIPGIARLISAE